jgi:predicted DsbA family dithiol-disulfide isomerase
MAENVLTLLANSNQAQSLIACAKRIAQKFGWERVREPLFEAYFPEQTRIRMANAMEGKNV